MLLLSLKKYSTALFFCLLFSFTVFSQSSAEGFNRSYQFLRSGNLVADKNFYLITVIDRSPEIKSLLQNNEDLRAIALQRKELTSSHVNDTCKTAASLVSGFRWTSADSADIDRTIRNLYAGHPQVFDKTIDRHLRPSGYYQRFAQLSNRDLFLKAWMQYIKGINYIIDQYGLGKKMRYPSVDSASYDVNDIYYRYMVKAMFSYLDERKDSGELFYQPSLAVALRLMQINERDEPARYEPMEKGANRKAAEQAGKTNWNKFAYSAILVPGEGPELTAISISPAGKWRCDLAADRYKKQLAPFIIVSGGHVHPFQTPYCEAIEMKKYLMNELHIPEAAIIIEPQARHTTTNFRNAERLILRHGFPRDMPALCVTTKDQADYIDHPKFDERSRKELGYIPYRDKKRIDNHSFVFYPVMESLHMDPYDPLDP